MSNLEEGTCESGRFQELLETSESCKFPLLLEPYNFPSPKESPPRFNVLTRRKLLHKSIGLLCHSNGLGNLAT